MSGRASPNPVKMRSACPSCTSRSAPAAADGLLSDVRIEKFDAVERAHRNPFTRTSQPAKAYPGGFCEPGLSQEPGGQRGDDGPAAACRSRTHAAGGRG